MRAGLVLLAAVGLLISLAGCGRSSVVEGKVEVTSTEPFKKLKGNTPRPPVVPER